jgi:DASH complex subunit ASK1
MHRVQLNLQSASTVPVKAESQERVATYTPQVQTESVFSPHAEYVEEAQDEMVTVMPHPRLIDDDDSDDSDDEINDNAHPSAAFLMASRPRSVDDDDSFGSSNQSDDMDNAPRQMFVVNAAYDMDDSFDDSGDLAHGQEEETIFGAPPAVRQRMASGQQYADGAGNLDLMGGELDTMEFDQRLRHRRVYDDTQESPTAFRN